MNSSGQSFHIQHKTFEVFAFGVVDVDGVIGRLVELVEDADMTTALGRCREDGEAELLLVDSLGAGEGEDDATGADLLEGDGIEARIAFECIAERVLVLGEGRGIEHDEVIVATGTFEELKSIFGKGFVARVAREVEVDVAACELDGLGGHIYTVHPFCSSAHGVDGESSGVAEHVQDGALAAILFEKTAVFTLVNEETSLLAMQPVDVEL